MPTSTLKLYAERDHYQLSPQYERHLLAMTAEGLYSKSAIAAELAHRDIEIERLRDELQRARIELAQTASEALRAIGKVVIPSETTGQRAPMHVAGERFVQKFKREPASPSDAAWLNGFVEACSPLEPTLPQAWPNEIARAGFNELGLVSTKSGAEKASAKFCDHRRGVDDKDCCVMCGEPIPPLNGKG